MQINTFDAEQFEMKKIRQLLCFLISLIPLHACAGFHLEKGAWNTFEGQMGDNSIQISLYLSEEGKIDGNCVYGKDQRKFSIKGTSTANAIYLQGFLNNKPWGIFKGNIFTDTLDKFEGKFFDSLNNAILFSTRLLAINWGDYEHRYDMFGTTSEIEDFMEQVKQAILSGDKEWISNHIHYPTRQVLHIGYTSISNKKMMMKYFDEVFDMHFKNKIRHAFTTNLFCRNSAVMLNDGEIWVGNTTGSTSTNYNFNIIAINH